MASMTENEIAGRVAGWVEVCRATNAPAQHFEQSLRNMRAAGFHLPHVIVRLVREALADAR
jgi:hypothetical protein